MRSVFFAARAFLGIASAAAPTPAAWISLRREMVIALLLVGSRTKAPRLAKSNTPGGQPGALLTIFDNASFYGRRPCAAGVFRSSAAFRWCWRTGSVWSSMLQTSVSLHEERAVWTI